MVVASSLGVVRRRFPPAAAAEGAGPDEEDGWDRLRRRMEPEVEMADAG